MKSIGIFVYDVSLTGGAERVAINLAENLSDYYTIHLISLFGKKNTCYNHENLKYKNKIINQDTVRIPFHLLSLSKKLKKYLLDNKIDVLLVITAGIITVALNATRGVDVKVVYCEHSNLENKTYGKKHEIRQYFGAKFSNKVVVLTNRDKENFIKKFNLSNDKVLAIPNWIDTSDIVDKYSIKSKKIISVGRLEKVKGYDLLVKVAEKVFEKHPDWQWDIYGDGSYKDKIEKWINDKNLYNFITLKGNSKELKNLYNSYSFCVMTSYYEGFPMTLLEAQSHKLPIVSFNCPTGPSEIVENNVNGFIIENYNIDEMANKINLLINNKTVRSSFSKNAQLSLSRYSKEEVLSKWIELINLL